MTSDPRFLRSAEALRRAVLELAKERPVEAISVTEIAKAAGVTRATFYNHATSPQVLLTAALSTELDRIREEFLALVREHPERAREVWSGAGHVLLDHIEQHRDVYRTGLTASASETGSVLAALLSAHIEATLHVYLSLVGAPDTHDGQEAARLGMRAAFLSHGMVGAYRAWLTAPTPVDRDEAVAVLFESTPAWWFSLVEPTT